MRLALPFYCHEVGLVDGVLSETERKLCSGFTAEMSRRHDQHFYVRLDGEPGYRESHTRALRSLMAFEDAMQAHDAEAMAEVYNALDPEAAAVLDQVFKL